MDDSSEDIPSPPPEEIQLSPHGRTKRSYSQGCIARPEIDYASLILYDDLNDINKSFEYSITAKHNDDFPMFMFVNPKSGSGVGSNILRIAKRQSTTNFSNQKAAYIRCNLQNIIEDGLVSITGIIANILNKLETEQAIEELKNLSFNSREKVKVLIGGGDGTYVGLINRLQEAKVDISNCAFGAVPLGTGNDLSNALGFGGSIGIIEDEVDLFNLLYSFEEGIECPIDLWNLELKLMDNGGKMCEVSNFEEAEKTYVDTDGRMKLVKEFNRPFINYFSIGFEAKIGFSFEKVRSGNRVINKALYFALAMRRYLCFCARIKTIKHLIQYFQVGHFSEDEEEINTKNTSKKVKNNKNIIFQSERSPLQSKIIFNNF